MSEHLIIYLDESGDLGFDFQGKKPSRYFVIAILVCEGNQANKATIQAVKKTLRNKLPKNTMELKGSNLTLAIKKYFLKEMEKNKDWCLYVAVADKLTWLEHHNSKHSYALTRTMLYDAVAERLFLNLDLLDSAKRVDIVIDRSKSKSEIAEFNKIVANAIRQRLPEKAVLEMRHAYSQEEAGIQAIDLFCIGAWRQNERADVEWYAEFQHRIASTVTYKF